MGSPLCANTQRGQVQLKKTWSTKDTCIVFMSATVKLTAWWRVPIYQQGKSWNSPLKEPEGKFENFIPLSDNACFPENSNNSNNKRQSFSLTTSRLTFTSTSLVPNLSFNFPEHVYMHLSTLKFQSRLIDSSRRWAVTSVSNNHIHNSPIAG